MIKKRCEVCGRIYLGERCACQDGLGYQALTCICGEEAVEVYVDGLGEWPLCLDCLRNLERQEGIELTLPVPRSLDGTVDEREEVAPQEKPPLPFDLTERQYQVAIRAEMTNTQIAKELNISVETVRTHMKEVFKKLNVHSRYDIWAVFEALPEEERIKLPPKDLSAANPLERPPKLTIHLEPSWQMLRAILEAMARFGGK